MMQRNWRRVPFRKGLVRDLANVVILYLIGLGAAAQFTKIAITFPALTAVYADAGSAVGFILSMLALCGAVFGLAAGRLLAFVSPKRTLLYSLAASAALSLFQAGMPQFSVMLALRAMEGVAHLAIVVAAPTLLASSTSDRLRPLAMTLWSTIVAAAFALTAFFGRDAGLAQILAVHGVVMAALLPIAAAFLEDGEASTSTHRSCRWSLVGIHLDAYRKASVTIPAVAFFAYASCYMSGLTLVSLYTGRAALAGILPSFGIAVTFMIVLPALDRVPATVVLKTGLAIAAAAALVLPWAPSAAAPWFLLYGALPFVQAASFAVVPQLASGHASRSLAYGAISEAGNLGNLVGLPLLLAVTQHAGQVGGALFIGGVLATALALQMTMGRRYSGER